MSGQVPDELPPGWDELGREDAAALAPPAGAKERVQRRVAFTLGLGAGFVAATAVSSTAAAASVASAAGGSSSAGSAATGLAGTLLAKKVLVLGVAAAVGIGGGTAAVLEVRSERARSRAATVAPPSRAPVARPQVVPPPEPPPAEPMAPDTLGEERALLDRARADIASGSLSAADSLLVRHAREFPAGQLAEEREALVIRLLVREGRIGEARVRATRFRQAHPRSIQLPGIADALGERR
ncbi:MAG: hypothetical protein ACXU81_05545 [Myxococcaceae bacterium]